MIHWKERFTKCKMEATIKYVVEGDPERYVVQCADACQGVGKCGNPSLDQVKLAIADLESHPQLEVHMTTCITGTVQFLALLTKKLTHRARSGEFDTLVITDLIEENQTEVENNHFVNPPVNQVEKDGNQITLSSSKEQSCLESSWLDNDKLGAFQQASSLLSDNSVLHGNKNVQTLEFVLEKVGNTHKCSSLVNVCVDGGVQPKQLTDTSNVELDHESINCNYIMLQNQSTNNNRLVSCKGLHTTSKSTVENSTNKKYKLSFVSKPEYIKNMSPTYPTRYNVRAHLMKSEQSSPMTYKRNRSSCCDCLSYLKHKNSSRPDGSERESYCDTTSSGIDANSCINCAPESKQALRKHPQSEHLDCSPQTSCGSSKIHGKIVSTSNKEEISLSVKLIRDAENSSVHEKHCAECGGKCVGCKHATGVELNNTAAQINRWFSQTSDVRVLHENRKSQFEAFVNESCQASRQFAAMNCQSVVGCGQNEHGYDCERSKMGKSSLTSLYREEQCNSSWNDPMRCDGTPCKTLAPVYISHHYSSNRLPDLSSKLPDKHSHNNSSKTSNWIINSNFPSKEGNSDDNETCGEWRKRLNMSVEEEKIQQVLLVLPQADPNTVAAMLKHNDVEQTVIA
ncbi:uncharacterized protein LOC121384131 [Gigantopelta aegis]|uniref:uncharacterized protein LOC121384131 n=1 Tax=Gigantopelta aegis TaxID=1735272 RepID=UPI001B8883C0|nr:uncharacterized protein LOC121384131 [Gigantopelta aegis]